MGDGTAGGTIEVDYLIKGAGAAGMAFADELLTHTDATIAIVDRRDKAGGHWNDAYPFVRLHQPSSYYGVGSTALGTGRIDEVGLNAGYHELASGQEVLSHFDLVMRDRFLPSGRVRFLPMSDLDDDGVATSLVSGATTRIEARRTVDATHSRMQIPSTTPPAYAVAPGVTCVPPNRVRAVAAAHRHFVVVGAGKTGMDTCVWLLANGADPDQITWVVPRDSWVLDRGNFQGGEAFFARFCRSLADQVDAVAGAESVDDVFARLEASGELRRIDPDVEPTAYHCAILSDGEVAELRRITDVVRLGRITSIDEAAIHLEGGDVEARPDVAYIDCSAAGIPTHPSTPVFDGDRITLQWIRTCQPAFSAAMVGFVEATFEDEDEKNRICTPIEPPTVPHDWLRMLRVELANRACWSGYPQLGDWMADTRLDAVSGLIRTRYGVDPEATEHLGRYLALMGPAMAKLDELLGPVAAA
jgi:hypothetical protein